jgi:5-methylcytosine-specific restriction endonuclease McrA
MFSAEETLRRIPHGLEWGRAGGSQRLWWDDPVEAAIRYKVVHHVIRSKLYHGLLSEKMSMRSLYDDERLKMTVPQACYYCDAQGKLAVDHLIPKVRGGPDEADNLIWACRSCNSSK